MADTGFTLVGTGVEDTSFGSPGQWFADTVANITADDGSYAESDGFPTTTYLKGTNVGLVIPSGATIDGIEVQVQARRASGSPDPGEFERVRIVNEGGAIGSDEQSTNDAITTSPVNYAFGGAAELWADTWSEADVENSNFGFVCAFIRSSGSNVWVDVDAFWVKVYYTGVNGVTQQHHHYQSMKKAA